MGQTRCSTHQECALPDTECGFVDSYLQPSFGNVVCGSCTSRPTCLVNSGGAGGESVGVCVCMLRPVTSQSCAVSGQRVIPNPGQVCLASLSGGASSSSSYAVSWWNLVSAQCVLLNQAQVFCLTVFDGDASVLMAVGLSLLSSGNRRRMLMSIDNNHGGASSPYVPNVTEWALAAEPCRTLMLTWRYDGGGDAGGGGGASPPITTTTTTNTPRFGPVDAFTAAECVRWRDIGERAVVRFNLTRVPPVVFSSFTSALELVTTDPEAATQLARNGPALVVFIVTYQTWFQPVVVLGMHYWNLLNRSSVLFSSFAEVVNGLQTDNYNNNNNSTRKENQKGGVNGTTTLGGGGGGLLLIPPTIDVNVVWELVPLLYPHRVYDDPSTTTTIKNNNNASNNNKNSSSDSSGGNTTTTAAINNNNNNSNVSDGDGGVPPPPPLVRTRRSLLKSSWKENLEVVKDFTVDIVNQQGGGASLAVDFAAQWAIGPFSWPPNYDYRSPQQCLVASLMFNYTLRTFRSTSAYYTGDPEYAPPRPVVLRTFRGCIPNLTYAAFNTGSSSLSMPSSGSLSSTLRWLTSFIDRGYIMGYISRPAHGQSSQLSKDVMSLFTCNFDTVQHCSRFTRDLLWGSVVVLLGLGCVSLAAKAAGIPCVDPVLILLFVPLVSVYVFGVSPMCAPMLSTCFVDEFLHVAEYIFPSSMTFPDSLQWWAGCASGRANANNNMNGGGGGGSMVTAGTASCFKSCIDQPFGFKHMLDNLAWITLRFGIVISDLQWPVFTTDSVEYVVRLLGYDPFMFRVAYETKRPYLDWPDMSYAQDLCCSLTLFNILPFVVGVMVIFVVVGYAVIFAFSVIEVLAALALDAVLYTHTR